MRSLAVVAVLAAVLAGCGSTGGRSSGATAVLESRSASKVSGTAVFTPIDGGWVHLRVSIANTTPGLHAVHIHEKGDCSAADAASAGGHWNPTGKKHGRWMQPDGNFHAGDLGNIEVGPDGTGSLEITTPLFCLGCACAKNVIGRSVVVHEKPDDFVTDPHGNAGARIACGPIQIGR